ncbi:hypothetical protein T492DRAFT_526298 [Pavlovales sp. CCMP2436]|nr:hypothetical protein T492DRAFT_526298 [Pavlovales sp. CCMP2436]
MSLDFLVSHTVATTAVTTVAAAAAVAAPAVGGADGGAGGAAERLGVVVESAALADEPPQAAAAASGEASSSALTPAHEVLFSLSNTSLKLFDTVVIPAQSSRRVWVHFRPAVLRGRLAADLPMPPTPTTEVVVMAFVSCRLVRDHRTIVTLNARCHPPHMAVAVAHLTYAAVGLGGADGADADADGAPPPAKAMRRRPASSAAAASGGPLARLVLNSSGAGVEGGIALPTALAMADGVTALVPVTNLNGLSELVLEMRPTTFFFDVELVEGPPGAHPVGGAAAGALGGGGADAPGGASSALRAGPPRRCVVPAGATVVFRVRPREAALREHGSFLRKARYVIEHFSVYNVRDLNEHWRVAITLSCARSDLGHSRALSQRMSVLGASKRAPAFLHLEEEVLRFHCAFRDFWGRRLRALGTAAASECVEGAPSPLPLSSEQVLATLPPSAVFGSLGDESEHAALWFSFRFLTDEFVFYGVQGSAAMAVVLQLAVLCYASLFQHEIFAGPYSRPRSRPRPAAARS